MVLRKTLLSCAALGILTGASLMQANAQDSQLNFTGGAFNFTGGTLSATSTDVAFNYYVLGGTKVSFATPVQAYLTLTGTAGPASSMTLGGTTYVGDTLSNVSESIVAAQTGPGGFTAGQTLLSLTGQSASLVGYNNSLTFSLGGTSIFSSDVFPLTGPETQLLTLNTSSTLGVTGTTLNSFTATGGSNVYNGTFNSAAVPEASTMIGLGGLILGGGFLGLRRRKV